MVGLQAILMRVFAANVLCAMTVCEKSRAVRVVRRESFEYTDNCLSDTESTMRILYQSINVGLLGQHL